MSLGDMNIKIGADIAEALAKINELKKANLQLAEETRSLTSEYNKNAKELRALEGEQKKGINVTAQATKKIDDLRKAQQILSASIVDNKNLLKQSTQAIGFLDKSAQQAANSSGALAGGLSKAYAGLSKIANIIPGLGIGALAGIIAGPLIDAFTKWAEATDSISHASKLFSDTLDASSSKYAEAVETVSRLREEINLAKDGFLKKDQVVKDYNESIGKTTGFVKSLDAAEKALNKNAEAYIKFTFLKAVANEANAQSAKKAVEAALALLKPDTEFVSKGEAIGQGIMQSIIHPLNSQVEALEGVAGRIKDVSDENRKDVIDSANSDSKALAAMAKSFSEQAAALAKKFKFSFFGDPKPGIAKAAKQDAIEYTETLQHALDEIFKKGFQRPDDPFKNLLGGKVFVDLSAIKEQLDAIKLSDAAAAAFQSRLEKQAQFVQDTLSPIFSELFTSIADGSTSAFQAFGNALKSLVTQLATTLAKAAALAAVMTFIFPSSKLGALGFKGAFNSLLGLAEGGHVKGPGSGTSDSIPARLSAGEYVMPANIVQKHGVGFFDAIRKGSPPPSFFNGLPKFATGGYISPSLVGSIGGGQEIRIVGKFELRGDRLVAMVKRGNDQIRRSS